MTVLVVVAGACVADTRLPAIEVERGPGCSETELHSARGVLAQSGMALTELCYVDGVLAALAQSSLGAAEQSHVRSETTELYRFIFAGPRSRATVLQVHIAEGNCTLIRGLVHYRGRETYEAIESKTVIRPLRDCAIVSKGLSELGFWDEPKRRWGEGARVHSRLLVAEGSASKKRVVAIWDYDIKNGNGRANALAALAALAMQLTEEL